MSGDRPVVSFVVPARNEARFLERTLGSIEELPVSPSHETIVVDGDSTDRTPEVARRFGVRLVSGDGSSRGAGRELGATAAGGDWLAFIDADTTVLPGYLEAMLSFARDNNLAGAASRCRVTGGWRSRVYELFFNEVLWRLSPPVFPGFHIFVRRDAYDDVGGFEPGPNEDVTFSRRLGRQYPTGFCPQTLVETSGRRIDEHGLVGTTLYYTRKEWHRQLSLRLK